MSQQNNLWEVDWEYFGTRQFENLWIIAATAGMAATKALKFLRRRECHKRGIKVTKISHRGTIDVF